MQFVSFTFLFLFLPLTLGVYYLVPLRWKPKVLLGTNLIYLLGSGWFVAAVELLLTLVTFGVGQWMAHWKTQKVRKKLILSASILLYVGAFVLLRSELSTRWAAISIWGVHWNTIGFSFFILHGIGYCLDVEREKILPEKKWLSFASYMLFYPKLMMGPVVSYTTFQKMQMATRFSFAVIGRGVVRLVIGVSKLLLLANWLGLVFQTLHQTESSAYSLVTVWVGAFAQFLTLFLTFSGLVDMAIGIGMCYGVTLPESYGKTAFFPTVSHFADQWNRTVVQWFSHYVGTHFHGKHAMLHLFAVMTTWGCIGLWHGLCASTLLFGLLIGGFLWLEYMLRRKKYYAGLHVFLTILLLSLGAVLLTLTDWRSVWAYLRIMFGAENIAPTEADSVVLRQFILILLLAVCVCSGKWRSILRKLESYTWFQLVRMPASILLVLILLLLNVAVLVFYHGTVPILWM